MTPTLINFKFDIVDLKLQDKNTNSADTTTSNPQKSLGQVMTPHNIVELMTHSLTLLNKKILEPSCGDGAFLVHLAKTYCKEFLKTNNNLHTLKAHLEQNLVGIEIDKRLLDKCKMRLDSAVAEFGLSNVEWNLIEGDFLKCYTRFKEQMDIVIGNPPYIRIHNINKDARSFTNGGMGDLYLIFFELGFKCLNTSGELIYITPSSWLNSKAGTTLRTYIKAEQNLVKLIDFAHEKIFKNITTYALISFFKKGAKRNSIILCEGAETREIPYEKLFLNNNIYLGQSQKILECKSLPVKNGFATLCDEFFIGDFKGLNYPIIKVLKASNGAWADCIYPYSENGKFEIPNGEVLKRYEVFKERLINRDLRGADYRAFGRTQGLKDTYKRKIAFNTLIKDIKDIKIYEVPKGCGVYSGLYLVSETPLSEFERVLKSDEFMCYIKSLRKYKNGGYYTFNSADLGKYLSWRVG